MNPFDIKRTRQSSLRSYPILALVSVLGLGSSIAACNDDDSDKSGTTTGSSATRGTGVNGGSSGSNISASPGTGASDTPSGNTTTPGTTGTSASGSATSTNATGAGGSTGAESVGAAASGSPAVANPGGSAGAAGTTGTAGTADGGTPVTDAGVPSDAGVQTLNDGQILLLVDTLNSGEVEEARAALPRLQEQAVRAFAREMIDDHEPVRDSLLQLSLDQNIDPQPSDAASALRQRSEEVVSGLLLTGPDEIDAVYLGSQAEAHARALELLENLAAAADSEALRAQLTQLITSVRTHLETATELERNLSDD